MSPRYQAHTTSATPDRAIDVARRFSKVTSKVTGSVTPRRSQPVATLCIELQICTVSRVNLNSNKTWGPHPFRVLCGTVGGEDAGCDD